MSLKIWLPLNGNTENQGLADVTITNNGATIDNNGKIGKCYSFNGSDSYISTSDITYFSPDNTRSICFWMYSNSETSAAIIGTGRTTWQWVVGTNGNKIRVHQWNSSGVDSIYLDSKLTITINTWYHIGITWDKSVIKLYINGQFDSQMTPLYTTYRTQYTTNIGGNCYYNQGNSFFNGKLNDFRIYDECLSADQIKEISRGMVLHYKMCMPINRLNAKTCTPQNGSWTNSLGYNIIISQKDDYFEFTGSPTAAAGSFNGILLSTPFTGKTLKYFWSEVSGVSEFYGYTSGNNDMDFHFSGATIGSQIHAKLRLALYDDNCDFYVPFDTRNIEYDGSGFKNHGTVSGNVTLSADSPRYTGSYSLADGKYVTAPGLTYINSGSISFWAKINTIASNGWLPFTGPTTSYYIMASTGGTGSFYHNAAGKETKTIYEDGKVITAPSSIGVWHHYVITNVDLTTWTKFMINNYDYNWNANMQMSDIRVYSTILDATAVAELYKLGRN